MLKKSLCAALALFLMPIVSLSAYALCDVHNYSAEHIDANCSEKGKTVYVCGICEDSYTVYDDEFTAPESMYVLFQSEKNENTITLSAYIYNNPGFTDARIQINYNKEAVLPVKLEVGEAGGRSLSFSQNPTAGYFKANFESKVNSSTVNGLYFTAIFDIVNPDADSGIRPFIGPKDFVDFDDEEEKIIDRKPKVIDLIGKSDLGDHSWTFDKIIKEPDTVHGGEAQYICAVCGETKTEYVKPIVPVWKKGDLDNNGVVNTRDAFLLKKALLGYSPAENAESFAAAADMNGDGDINEKDFNLLQQAVLGK